MGPALHLLDGQGMQGAVGVARGIVAEPTRRASVRDPLIGVHGRDLSEARGGSSALDVGQVKRQPKPEGA